MISTWFTLALFKSYFTSTLNKTCPIFKKKIDKKKLYQNIAVEVENDYYILTFRLTLSWRRSLSYRKQSIDFLCNDRNLCHESVNQWGNLQKNLF